MQMLILHNARERTEEDFKELFKQADPHLRYQHVWRKGGSVAASTILEALFVDDNAVNRMEGLRALERLDCMAGSTFYTSIMQHCIIA